jgi:glutaminyl-peptide cyclotransferase
MSGKRFPTWTLLLALLMSCSGAGRPPAEPQRGELRPLASRTVDYGYEVVQSFPHDPTAFTQGLLYDQGRLLESTGLYGSSSLREVELATGRVLRKIQVPEEYFAEGLALFQSRLFQLTWQSGKGFIYDRTSFQQRGEFSYSGEGWGLTHDGRSLILSDGTHVLRYLDPTTFAVQRAVMVLERDRPLRYLNELEYIEGEIYANVWTEDVIVCIDPLTGLVKGRINLAGLLTPQDRTGHEDVLNGIAYDPEGKRIFVTGKFWSRLYQIRRIAR